jgi:hypothetical protein
MPGGTRDNLYQLKVMLKDTKPPVWRRVLVPADMSLGVLHYVLQIVMGWTDSHLHQFVTRSKTKRPTPDDWAAALKGKDPWEIDIDAVYGERRYSNPEFELEGTHDEAKVRLGEVAPRVGSKLAYEYDFGDGWTHELTVEKALPPDESQQVPRCLTGKRNCPPEDCGGVWGYSELLDALADPEHERHEELREWLGDDFDPEHFDIQEVNTALDQLRRPRRRKRE